MVVVLVILGIIVGVFLALAIPIATMILNNGLIRRHVKCDDAWADIDVQLKRRHDLIPNLVEVIKNYAAYEQRTLIWMNCSDRTGWRRRWRVAVHVLLWSTTLAIGVGRSVPVDAACNVIPQATQTFDSVLGATNRPFAAPSELLEVRVRPCDATSPGFSVTPTDQLVTVLFTPNGGATRHAVVLAAGSCSSLSGQLSACQAQLGGGQATCVEGSTAGLQIVQRPDGPHLQFLFPNTDSSVGTPADALTLAGPATIAVTQTTAASLPCTLATSSCSAQLGSLSGLIACIDGFYADDGACGRNQPQGIFNHFTALPVPNDFRGACIADTPPCNPVATQFRLATDQDGNLLMPMNWQGILLRQGGVPFPRLLRASFDTPVAIQFPGQSFFASFSPDGGPLAPIFVPQFDTTSSSSVLNLFGSADAPYTVLRIARRSDNFEQCHGGTNDALPCNDPDDCPGQCAGGSNGGLRCVSDSDCPGSACSAPSPGSCGLTDKCVGGTNNSQPCTADSFCPGGQCGAGLFDAAPLTFAGDGPVVIPRMPGVCASGANSGMACTTPGQCPGSFCLTNGFCQEDTTLSCSLTTACSSVPCVDFQLTAENPIPLASLAAQSANVFGFTTLEGIDNVDRDGDGDLVDSVVTLRDSKTGTQESLGAPSGFVNGVPTPCVPPTPAPQGRAVVQIDDPPFRFPAVAPAGNLLAFLESEGAEGFCDENGDTDRLDSTLRVFRSGATATELTNPNPANTTVVDANPEINGQSIAISNGIVFYRHTEAGQAKNLTERVSVGSGGTEGSGGFAQSGQVEPQGMSADGRYVAFWSFASNLVLNDTNNAPDAFVHDRQTGQTVRVSVSDTGAQSSGSASTSEYVALSADGRFVAFDSQAALVLGDTNGVIDVFVHDRDLDGNGVFDETGPGRTTTVRVSVDSNGTQATDADSYVPSISADGRFIAFVSTSTQLAPGANGQSQVFVHDRDADGNGTFDEAGAGKTRTVLASVSSSGQAGNGNSVFLPVLSANGRFVAFSSSATNLVPNDMGVLDDVFVHDLSTGTTERVSVASDGTQGNGSSGPFVGISGDGRYVVFGSLAGNLDPNDIHGVNAFTDVFVHDRQTGITELVSVDSSGVQTSANSFSPVISTDGRFVAFLVGDPGLVPNDNNGLSDVYVHDRVSGATDRVSVATDGTQAAGTSAGGSGSDSVGLSGDGRFIMFTSAATNLVNNDMNGETDVFVRGPDPSDTGSDITGDGDNNDTVLEVLDTTPISPVPPVALCPADQVSVAGGAAAFLRPESAGPTSNSGCTGPMLTGPDLNGDGDSTDNVVEYVPSGGTVQNLGLAAAAVSLSGSCNGGVNVNRPCADNTDCPGSTCVPSVLAALVSEAGQNADLNGDTDKSDTVVEVHPAGSGSWSNVRQAADTVQVEGTFVAFITPEAAQGNTDLNGDRDTNDRVLQVYDARTATLTNVQQAAEEFVMGTQLASCGTGPVIAFRTSETAQGNTNLNGDGDTADYVLQVYVPGIGLTNTHQAVTPCNLQACNPRQPYLVQGDTVKFLTYEGDQNQDLNGNGTKTDVILQIFDACSGTLTTAGAVDTTNTSANPLTNGGTTTQSKVAFATTAGVCASNTTTYLVPAMCSSDADCPMGATCQSGNSIVAAPAVIPTHYDSVVTPPKPLTVIIPVGPTSVTATLKVKVGNGDVRPVKDKVGHTVQLTVSDGTCPAGTVAGLPDFDSKASGAQNSILIKGGAAKTAKVPLLLTASAFATVNHTAPYRCTLKVTVSATGVTDNIDPTAANNSASVELNVIDLNNSQASSAGDAVIASVTPVRVTIGKHAASMAKTRSVGVHLVNVDTAPATLTVTATDGTCPAGTVTVKAPNTATVAGGKTGRVTAEVTATNAAFLTANGKSPARCTATLTVSGTGSDPDPTNNTTQVVIDVVDKEDY